MGFRILKQKNPRGYSSNPLQWVCLDTISHTMRAGSRKRYSAFVTVNSLHAP